MKGGDILPGASRPYAESTRRVVAVRCNARTVVCIAIFLVLIAGALLARRLAATSREKTASSSTPRGGPVGNALTVLPKASSVQTEALPPDAVALRDGLAVSRDLGSKAPSAAGTISRKGAPATARPTEALSSDSVALRDGLAFSRDLGSKALVAAGRIVTPDGDYTMIFEYRRRNTLERVRVADINFVRQAGGQWVKSDAWSLTGTAASPGDNSLLADLIAVIQTPWDAGASPDPTQTFGRVNATDGKIVFAKTNGTAPERLFVFRRLGQRLQLDRFSGPVGREQLEVTLDFTYPVATASSLATATPAPTRQRVPSKVRGAAKPSPSPRKRRHAKSAHRG